MWLMLGDSFGRYRILELAIDGPLSTVLFNGSTRRSEHRDLFIVEEDFFDFPPTKGRA